MFQGNRWEVLPKSRDGLWFRNEKLLRTRMRTSPEYADCCMVTGSVVENRMFFLKVSRSWLQVWVLIPTNNAILRQLLKHFELHFFLLCKMAHLFPSLRTVMRIKWSHVYMKHLTPGECSVLPSGQLGTNYVITFPLKNEIQTHGILSMLYSCRFILVCNISQRCL